MALYTIFENNKMPLPMAVVADSATTKCCVPRGSPSLFGQCHIDNVTAMVTVATWSVTLRLASRT